MAELDRAGICRRMAQARNEKGLTQPEIAELLEPPVHFRTVQLWETGEKDRKTGKHRWSVPFDRLEEWARLTGSSRDWLLHGEAVPATTDRLEALEARVAEAIALSERILARLGGLEPPATGAAQR